MPGGISVFSEILSQLQAAACISFHSLTCQNRGGDWRYVCRREHVRWHSWRVERDSTVAHDVGSTSAISSTCLTEVVSMP